MRGALALGVLSILLLAAVFAGGAAAGRQHVLAAFTTDLSARSDAQKANIRAALARIDGVTVPPGHAFSFNRVVGQRVLEQGFDRAPAFEPSPGEASYQQGGVADVPGGGICQLSSTVYNVALLAGMRIVERSPHVRPVASVGPGRDATVLYGKWDLRWSNPHPWPVVLRGRVAGDRLVVELVGAHPLPQPVSIEVERVAGVDAPGGLRVRTWRRQGGRIERVSEDSYL